MLRTRHRLVMLASPPMSCLIAATHGGQMTATAENSGETGDNVAAEHGDDGQNCDRADIIGGVAGASLHHQVVPLQAISGAADDVANAAAACAEADAFSRDATTRDVCRGVGRLLRSMSFAVVRELVLPNGRRADVVGLSPSGAIWIVEVKSCVDDFRVDQKWPEYMEFADALFFAVSPQFPQELLPAETGLMLADRYGGEIVREAPEERLAAARRKAMTLRFARAAAFSLQMLADPDIERA
ncbi:MmcB family DNA repair protein [Hyphomicrobium sulfonivorans]|uniref:MmcB family DNA repair protein n=1 Tax=Hyphomicrobium sulfonivorans TaxID=121290 RepID=UPI001FD92034|nr:MmcB family DNA repair protein [Hyphomicrobium sulfonivorans]